MKLSAILQDLTSGEFRQHKMGGAELGAIQPEKYAELGSSLNLALTDLHTRFSLRRGTTSLTRDGSPSYTLSEADLLKIEEVIPATGLPVHLEKPQEERHVLLVDYKTLTFSEAITETEFLVRYRADHPELVLTASTDPETVDITLPNSHRQALLYKVASRIFMPMDRPDGQSLGNKFLSLYEAACLQLENKNVSPESRNEYVGKLEMRGFV